MDCTKAQRYNHSIQNHYQDNTNRNWGCHGYKRTENAQIRSKKSFDFFDFRGEKRFKNSILP